MKVFDESYNFRGVIAYSLNILLHSHWFVVESQSNANSWEWFDYQCCLTKYWVECWMRHS